MEFLQRTAAQEVTQSGGDLETNCSMFVQRAYILGSAKGMEARAAHQIRNEVMPQRISELEVEG